METKVYKNSRLIQKQVLKTILKQRIEKLGSITTAEVWTMCRERKEFISYSSLQQIFKEVMTEMEIAGFADIIRNGVWFIHKQGYSKIFN